MPTFENYPAKEELRIALLTEQGWLCCYCMNRITAERMKIEHWHSQTAFPDKSLDYRNLLGACLGNEGQAFHNQHCDTRKGDHPLSRNPADPLHDVEPLLHYLVDGTVTSPNQQFASELESVLNLNFSLLVRNRKAVLDAFVGTVRKIAGRLTRSQIEREIKQLNSTDSAGMLRPYCQVVIYYLRKKLQRP